MERLKERHFGVAVIKDKTKLQQAMAKLAKYEDEEEQRKLPRMSAEEFLMRRFERVDWALVDVSVE